jgi:hypothetical protein
MKYTARLRRVSKKGDAWTLVTHEPVLGERLSRTRVEFNQKVLIFFRNRSPAASPAQLTGG